MTRLLQFIDDYDDEAGGSVAEGRKGEYGGRANVGKWIPSRLDAPAFFSLPLSFFFFPFPFFSLLYITFSFPRARWPPRRWIAGRRLASFVAIMDISWARYVVGSRISTDLCELETSGMSSDVFA